MQSLRLSLKLILVALAPLLTGMGALYLILSTFIQQETSDRLAGLRAKLERGIIQELRGRIESAHSIIAHGAANGQTQEECQAAIGAIRFGDENYIWVHQLDCEDPHSAIMLVHAADHLVGQDLSGSVDMDQLAQLYHEGQIYPKDAPEVSHIEGTELFEAFNRVCLREGAGVIRYYWPKIRDGYASDTGYLKMSYVKYFPAWDWVLGAGAYADHIDALVESEAAAIRENFASIYRLLILVFVGIGLTLGVISLLVSRGIAHGIARDKDALLRSNTLLEDENERRKRIEADLLRIRQAIDSSGDAISISDARGNHFYQNQTFTELFGWTATEVNAQGPQILYADEKVAREVFVTIMNGESWNGELEIITKAGRHTPVALRANAVKDENGEIIGLIGTHTDITERRLFECAMQSAIESAEDANQAKSEFLANMSHEIRTPMNGVVGMTGLLLGTDLDDEQREFATTVKESAEALLTIINDILDFSKIEAGKLDLEMLDFDLRTTLESTTDLLALRAGEKGLEFIASLRMGSYEGMDPRHSVAEGGRGFVHEEVRDHQFAMLEELATDYSVDAVELDFAAAPGGSAFWLQAEDAPEYTQVMTEFVRKTAGMVRERKGQPCQVGARVYPTEELNLKTGLDVQTWLAEGLVDFVVPMVYRDFILDANMPIGWIVDAAHQHDIAVYGMLQPYYRNESRRFHTVVNASAPMMRAAAANYWSRGVDGVYTWFLPWPLGEGERRILSEIGEPELLGGVDKVYFVRRRFEAEDDFDYAAFLPLEIPGTGSENVYEVLFEIADDPTDDSVRQVRLTLRISNLVEADGLSIELNGRSLSGESLSRTAIRRIDPYAGQCLEYKLEGGLPQQGENRLTFRLEGRPDGLEGPIVVEDVEIAVEYGGGRTA